MWFSEGNTLPLVGLPVVFQSNESKLDVFTCMNACQETQSRCLEVLASSLETFLKKHLGSIMFCIKYHRCNIGVFPCWKERVVTVLYCFLPGMYFSSTDLIPYFWRLVFPGLGQQSNFLLLTKTVNQKKTVTD